MKLDMDVDTEGHSHELEVFKDVYNKQNQVVWVIKIEGRVKSRSYESIYTGFTVRSDGYVMTCAHGGWQSWSGLTIKARRLDGTSGFEFGATIVSVKTKWDMCLLKIDLNDLKGCDCGKLASGKMDIGETIFVIGNPNEFVGSGLVGHVAYACTDAVEIDYNNYVETCYNFKSEALTCKPAYRIMGHIWHSDYFNHAEIQDRDTKNDRRFEKNLQPRLPIIQCYGLVGGFGTSGAPIFNRNGEIVGMLILESDGYQIGVHVTALQTFLKHAMPLQEVVKEDIEKVVLQGIGESSQDIAKKRKVSNVEEV